MWHLYMTKTQNEWAHAGDFETTTAAAKRIREMEGYPATGLFLEIHADTIHGTDEEAFRHLEHRGHCAAYVIKRRTH